VGNAKELSHVLHDLGKLSLAVGEGKQELTHEEKAERQTITTIALQTLRELLEAGHRDFRWLENARELAALREHPEFQQSLREYKK
jgi:hypothetical protein